MNSGLISQRYARGLYLTAGSDLRLASRFGRDLKMFRDLYVDEGLDRVLNNPAFLLSERLTVIDRISEVFGFHKNSSNLLKLMEKRGRMPLVDDVLRAYRILLDEAAGRKLVNVVTDSEVPPHIFASYRRKVQEIMGEMVIFRQVHRPKDLVAGVRIHMGDRIVDVSVEGMLSRLQARLGIPKGG